MPSNLSKIFTFSRWVNKDHVSPLNHYLTITEYKLLINVNFSLFIHVPCFETFFSWNFIPKRLKIWIKICHLQNSRAKFLFQINRKSINVIFWSHQFAHFNSLTVFQAYWNSKYFKSIYLIRTWKMIINVNSFKKKWNWTLGSLK